jgi:hypothetical protein
MTEIVLSSGFRKAFKRKVRGNKILETRFRDRAAIFENSPFDPRLKTHKLSGELDDLGVLALTMMCGSSFHSWKQIRLCLLTLEVMKKFIRETAT